MTGAPYTPPMQSKVDNALKITEYNAASYLTIDEFLGRWLSPSQIQNMDVRQLATYTDWVANANRNVESALYPYSDRIPIPKNSESWTYAKSMALHWAQYEKAADEGSATAKEKLVIYKMDKEGLIQTMKAQPQQSTTRRVTSSRFDEGEVELYSQTYGVSDIL